MNTSRIFPLSLAIFLTIGSLADQADAAAVINVTESGGAVFVSAAGSLNIADLNFLQTADSSAGINSSASFLEVSTGPVDLYGSISGPPSFGTGGFTSPSSGSGDRVGIRFGASSVAVPAGYVSGAPLSGTSLFTNNGFSQLGVTPGSYTWRWGSGANADSLTINVLAVPTPPRASLDINVNQNPVLDWQAEAGRCYSILYSTDLKNYFPIAKGFPFGGARGPVLQFIDLPISTRTTSQAFYRVEKDPVPTPNSAAELAAFFNANGGKSGFTDNQVKALETVLFALDEIEAGQLVAARTRVDAMLAAYPLSTGGWYGGEGYRGLNLGSPVGYYAVRMLDQILALGNPSRAGKLRMTAVVAASAAVTRPTLPDFAPETVQLGIAPEILADDARRLHLVTRLFRRWVQAISGGLHVELVVHVMNQNATVKFNRVDGITTSYPDAEAMVNSVPASLANTTDIWWVVAPSGVPGDGSGYNTHFVTGGMGSHSSGVPLILSDDAWFTRKPEHLGTGVYSEVELMMYQPNWLQHEFMHHLFRTWPEFGLEVVGHQWFDRAKWPADFVGNNEPDYYAEALTKRILGATPSVADALQIPDFADMSEFPVAKLLGTYQRMPVENRWHEVTVSLNGGDLKWNNAAGIIWGLEISGKELWWAADSPYGAQESFVEIDGDDNVIALRINGERYVRTSTPAAAP